MTAQLSDKALLLLRHGDTEERFDGDGSRIVGSIVLDAVNRGLHRDYLRRLLKDPQHRGGFACFRRRRDLDRWLDKEWDRATAKVQRSPTIGDRNEATLRAVELTEHVECLTWKGTGGATDRAVWLFVLSVAGKAGKLGPLALAVRTVAEGAGVEHRTAGRSLARLVDRGLLRRIAVGRGRHASLFQVQGISCPTGQKADATAPQWRSQIGRNCPTPSHTGSHVGPVWGTCVPSDAWRWRGLGQAKARTWALLSAEPLTTAELADALGVTPRTARRHLAALAEHDLAEHDDEGWIRGPASPDDVAEQIGTAGMAERQRERHDLERRLHDQALDAHAAVVDEPPFYIDPETGEIIPTEDLSPAPVRGRTPEANAAPAPYLSLVPDPPEVGGEPDRKPHEASPESGVA